MKKRVHARKNQGTHVHGKDEGSAAHVLSGELGLGGQRIEHHTKSLALLDSLHRVDCDDSGRRRKAKS
jgi:hypothetical protein